MTKKTYILIGLMGIFSLLLVLPVNAGTLEGASTTPDNPYITNSSNYAVSFEVASSTEIGAQIRLIFPAGFTVADAANATSGISVSSTLAAAIVASSTVSGQEITLWLADGSVAVASDTLIFSNISGIVNPSAAGSYTLGIETRTVANELSDAASSTAFTISGAYAQRSGSAANQEASPPTSTVTNPANGSTVTTGQTYTIKGTAEDIGGSLVNGVQVSLDGGATWNSATLGSSLANVFSWEYSWSSPTAGEYTIKSKATDTIGNVESPSSGIKVTVSAAATTVVEAPVATTKSSLSESQISSILGVLSSFGTDSATMAKVEAALRGTASAVTTTTTAGCSFTRDLYLGVSGTDVTCLQNYLIGKGHSIAAGATGYFGSQTQSAVTAWQTVNGVSPAAGYFGSISRAKYSSL